MGTVLVERSFDVPVSIDDAWSRLADVAQWPTWAPHIRAAELAPAGTLASSSSGVFRFSPVGSSRFAMVAFDPPRSWTWSGRAIGVPIDYEHAFDPIDATTTRLTWVVRTAGKPSIRAQLFALVYARLIDRAWPRFVEQVSRDPGQAS